MKVICTSNINKVGKWKYVNISIGNIYTDHIKYNTTNSCYIENDQNIGNFYPKYLFKPLSEYRKERISKIIDIL